MCSHLSSYSNPGEPWIGKIKAAFFSLQPSCLTNYRLLLKMQTVREAYMSRDRRRWGLKKVRWAEHAARGSWRSGVLREAASIHRAFFSVTSTSVKRNQNYSCFLFEKA